MTTGAIQRREARSREQEQTAGEIVTCKARGKKFGTGKKENGMVKGWWDKQGPASGSRLRRLLLILGGSPGEILGAVRARGGVHDGLLHAHVLWVDHAWLVGDVICIPCAGVHALCVVRIHHSGRGVGRGRVDLRRHAIGGHVGHGVVRHLGLVDGAGDGADVVLFGIVTRDDVDKEVKDVGFLNGGGDVASLQGASLSLLGLGPGAMRELEDEHLAGLCEEDGGLGGDHADVLVGLHDLLDACEREEMVLEVGGLLDLGHLLEPELAELGREFLEVVLLLQLGLAGLLLHEVGLCGHGIVRGGGSGGRGDRVGDGSLRLGRGGGSGGVVVGHGCGMKGGRGAVRRAGGKARGGKRGGRWEGGRWWRQWGKEFTANGGAGGVEVFITSPHFGLFCFSFGAFIRLHPSNYRTPRLQNIHTVSFPLHKLH